MTFASAFKWASALPTNSNGDWRKETHFSIVMKNAVDSITNSMPTSFDMILLGSFSRWR